MGRGAGESVRCRARCAATCRVGAVGGLPDRAGREDRPGQGNDSDTFIRFLRLLDSAIPAGQDIHLVWDNGSSHTSKKTRAWLAAHPRFHVHHTPKHASWLNQVEIFFSTLTRRVLRRGQFASRDDLAEHIDAFVLAYDEHDAKPYRWTYDGTPLKAA